MRLDDLSFGELRDLALLRGLSARAAHLGLQMLLKSESGEAYSEEDSGAWIVEAGFIERRRAALDEDRHLLTAILA